MKNFNVLSISSTALEAQRKRMNAIASNMANVHTTRTEEGGPYKRKDVIFEPAAVGESPTADEVGVRVSEVYEDPSPPQIVHEPGHPDADDNGFVAMPAINAIEEMVNMMTAVRSYEANVTVFNMTKSMILKALEIGR
jgi:flagellar basal-body rod protein FlgC